MNSNYADSEAYTYISAALNGGDGPPGQQESLSDEDQRELNVLHARKQMRGFLEGHGAGHAPRRLPTRGKRSRRARR